MHYGFIRCGGPANNSWLRKSRCAYVSFHTFLMDNLHLPLLNSATTTTVAGGKTTADESKSTQNILIPVVSIIVAAAISLWANIESSKCIDVVVINQVQATAAGRRFHLFFQSDDEAERIVLRTSAFLSRFLFPGQLRPVRRATLRLTTSNYTTYFLTQDDFSDEVILYVSSLVMEEYDARAAMSGVVRRGMIRALLWNGAGQVPEQLLDSMADSIAAVALADTRPIKSDYYLKYSPSSEKKVANRAEEDCWEGEEEGHAITGFLLYCEAVRPGFLARLYREIEHGWHGRLTIDSALGLPARDACIAYRRRLIFAGVGDIDEVSLKVGRR